MARHSQERNYALDVLKILATIGIVFHHFQQITGVRVVGFPDFYYGWFYWGYLVELFFILSGYFMYRYIPEIMGEKIKLSAWYFQRAKRLLPLVAVSAVVYELFLWIYQNIYHQEWFGIKLSFFGTITTSLGLQAGGAFANPSVNNPTWYISVLLICYVIFYALTSCAKRLKCSPMYMYLAMILLGCSIIKAGIQLPFLNSQVARGYYAFFFGVLLAGFIKIYGSRRSVDISALLLFIGLTYLFVEHPGLVQKDLAYILTFLMYPTIIILFETKIIQRIFYSKLWGVWGRISYDVFIWHNPFFIFMYIIIQHFDLSPDFTQIKYILLYTLFSEIIGVVSYFLLEKPLNRLIDRLVV